jgi:hypothetical protein
MDFKKKYLKYKNKYLKLKQFGGKKIIEYDLKLLDFLGNKIIDDDDSFNNLKESIYSCIYIIMSSMKDVCSPIARTVNCSLLYTFNFPFFTSSGFDIASCEFIEDTNNNNLVIVFGAGSVLYCDHFINHTYRSFIYIYKKLLEFMRKKPELKYIHIVGHSMGGSLAILFSYFIMTIEKSNSNYIYIPSIEYFSINYDINYKYKIFDETVFPEYIEKIYTTNNQVLIEEENGMSNYILHYNGIDNLKNIIIQLTDFLKEDYPKIGNKISVCTVGAFPVLFRVNDKIIYDEYLSFYKNRIIIFGNCENDIEKTLTNIGTEFCDIKIFNMNLKNSTNGTISELTNFNYININNLSVMKTNDTGIKIFYRLNDDKIVSEKIDNPEYTLDYKKKSDKLHEYRNNYYKLKEYVKVNEIVESSE